MQNSIGGKTGTTQNNADGWFFAVTPKLVAGAWVGGIYPEISFTDTRLGQGATMALPVFAKFYGSLSADNNFDSYSRANFKLMNSEWAAELDCDPFKEDFNFFDWLFGKNNDKAVAEKELKPGEKEQGFFKRVGNLFKKKKKDN